MIPNCSSWHRNEGLAGIINSNTTISIAAVASSTFSAFPNSCAQPGMNPGSRKNQSATQRMKRTRTAISWNVIGPRSLNFWRITLITSLSLPPSVFLWPEVTQYSWCTELLVQHSFATYLHKPIKITWSQIQVKSKLINMPGRVKAIQLAKFISVAPKVLPGYCVKETNFN